MKQYLVKTISGLVPADPQAEEWYQKIKPGEVISAEVKRVRNYQFHKKLFSLLNLAFAYWQPGEITSKYGAPEKNFNRFRKDITILAGYFHTEIRLDGSVRVVADSISFAKMDQNTFDKLYQNILTVVIDKNLYSKTPEEVEKLADQFFEYA